MPNSKVKSLILLAALPLFLTACSISDIPFIGGFFKSQPKSANLTVWGLFEPKEIMDVVIADYTATHPNVTITYEQRPFVSLKSYKESIFTRLSEGSAPDIVLVHNSWVAPVASNLTPAPSKLMSVDEYSGTFYPVAKTSAVIDNKVYAVPASYDGLALIYNKDMFSEVGISSAPTTWEDFRVAAAKLTKRDDKGNILQAGAAIGTANNIEHFSDIIGLLFAQGDINVPADLNTQSAADALTFYTNFATTEKVWSDVLQPSVEAFADKKVAMIFVPSWQILSVISRNPQVNIAVAPAPKALDLEGNPIAIDWGSFWMYSVSKNSQSGDAAWDFLKYLSSEEAQRKLFSEESKVRPFGQAYSRTSLQGELSGNAYLDAYVKTAIDAKSGVLASRSGNDKETDVLKTAVNSVLSGVPAAEALDTAYKSLVK